MDHQTAPDLRAYLGIISRRYKLIIAGVAFSMIGAILGTIFTTPVYEASTTLLVSERQAPASATSAYNAYQGLLLSERLAKTYSQMMSMPDIAEKVIKRLGLKESAKELSSNVSAEPIQDTNLIKLTVTSGDPKQAQRIANTTAAVFSEELSKIERSNSANDGNAEPPVRVSVVQYAILPEKPIKPKPLLNAVLALVLGSIISIGAVIAIERLDVSVKNSADLENAVGTNVLGHIPASATRVGPEVLTKPTSIAAEAYRSLRTNLQFLNFDESLNTIAVTSPSSGEGKTTVAANLAVALAKNNNRVVLVSCDLRKPKLHEVFHLDNDRGLTRVLAGAAELEDVLVPIVDGLRVITSGPIPPNPAELLGSERMKLALQRLRQSADFVILDCPPILAVTDAAVLSASIDGYLLVARAGQTNRHAAVRARKELDKISARVLGAVLNCYTASSEYGYGDGYYYEYRREYTG